MERQALAAQQRHAIYVSSGRYEVEGDEPTVADALNSLDAWLNSDLTPGAPRDELFELMGVGHA